MAPLAVPAIDPESEAKLQQFEQTVSERIQQFELGDAVADKQPSDQQRLRPPQAK
jgi:hypothetical protein